MPPGVLATVCGMRRGELAGLRWAKVDLRRGIVRSDWQQRTATGQGDHGAVEETKGSSARDVAIGAAAVAVLTAHRELQEAKKRYAGDIYRDEDRVFLPRGRVGLPAGVLHPGSFTRACEAAGVPVIALHDARHTSATVGADAGVPQHAMQGRLGHADSRVTADIYTHVLPPAQRKAAEVMERVLLPDADSLELG
jgi:integrase